MAAILKTAILAVGGLDNSHKDFPSTCLYRDDTGHAFVYLSDWAYSKGALCLHRICKVKKPRAPISGLSSSTRHWGWKHSCRIPTAKEGAVESPALSKFRGNNASLLELDDLGS